MKWRKVQAGLYELRNREGDLLATVANTSSTGTDDYPWDWYLADGVTSAGRKDAGVTDSLRSGKWAVEAALGLG